MSKDKPYNGKDRRKDEPYIRRIATIAAEKAVYNTLEKVGIDPENLKEAAANQRFVTDMREGAQETRKILKKGVLLAFLGGVLYIIKLGIESFKSN